MIMRDGNVCIITGQGPNCIMVNTPLGSQTKNKTLPSKRIHLQTNLHDCPTDTGAKMKLFETEKA